MPNTKRITHSEAKLQAQPVAAVMIDQPTTIRVSIARAPKRSASQPLGTSKRA